MALYRDLHFYHRIDLVDVVEGRGPAPFFLVSVVAGLPDTSFMAAMERGGREYLGWGEDREIRAGIFNALQDNTAATGNWKRKPPDLPKWPRPTATERLIRQQKPLDRLWNKFAKNGAHIFGE